MKKISLGKNPFLTTPLLTIVGRSGGIVLPFIIAFFYGAKSLTDAFFFAYSLIFLVIGVGSYLFESILVPYLVEFRKTENSARHFNRAVLLVILGIAVFLWLILAACLPVFLNLSGWDQPSASLTRRSFLELFPFLLFGLWSAALNGQMIARRIFWFPAFSPFLRSLIVLVFLIFFHRPWHIHALTLGYACGEILRWMLTLFLLKKLAPENEFQKSVDPVQLKVFFKEAGMQVFALAALNLIPLIDYWFASCFGEGKLSLYMYGERLIQIPYQIFLTGILPIFLTDWSEKYHGGERGLFWEGIRRDIRRTLTLALLFSALFWLLRQPAAEFIFGFSSLPPEDIRLIGEIFGWLILGFAPLVLNLLYTRIFFVMKKSGLYCAYSWGRLLLNILFNFVFIQFFGIYGIAISTTFVYILTAVWLYRYLAPPREVPIHKAE